MDKLKQLVDSELCVGVLPSVLLSEYCQDSLELIYIYSRIEEEFDVTLPEKDMSLNEIHQLIQNHDSN